MDIYTIKEIERALPYHINYNGGTTGNYLKIMDSISYGYTGAPAQKVCALLEDYYMAVGVGSLNEAIDRLKRLNLEA